MPFALRHVALFVQDLRAAEALYRQIFEMKVITREARLEDDSWHQAPHDKD